MPYKARGKCVYKGNKKVGCTKGSVKKYLTALRIHREFVEADVYGTSDTYAQGDARIPFCLGNVVIRRPGLGPRGTGPKTPKKSRRKKSTLFESKFIEQFDNEPIIIDTLNCVTHVTSKNLMQITEDIIQRVTPDYQKTILEDGTLKIEFIVNDEIMTNYATRLNGLLGDRLNKSIFVQLEKSIEKSQLEIGKKIEKEHTGTIKKLKKDSGTTVNKAAEMIARDHLGEHPKYYSELKKAKL